MSDGQTCVRQAFDCARLFPAAAALLCDELSLAVPSLEPHLVRWLHQIASKEFQSAFIDRRKEHGSVADGAGSCVDGG